MATELPKPCFSKCRTGFSPQRRRAGRTFLPKVSPTLRIAIGLAGSKFGRVSHEAECAFACCRFSVTSCTSRSVSFWTSTTRTRGRTACSRSSTGSPAPCPRQLFVLASRLATQSRRRVKRNATLVETAITTPSSAT